MAVKATHWFLSFLFFFFFSFEEKLKQLIRKNKNVTMCEYLSHAISNKSTTPTKYHACQVFERLLPYGKLRQNSKEKMH
jgi:hypothetical protein